MPALAIVSASVLVIVAVVVLSTARRRTLRKRLAFNCCEHCGASLPRDRTETWRYSARCGSCHRIQTWAKPTAG